MSYLPYVVDGPGPIECGVEVIQITAVEQTFDGFTMVSYRTINDQDYFLVNDRQSIQIATMAVGQRGVIEFGECTGDEYGFTSITFFTQL